jgi:Spy/CpxP family protein refolding chaperone
MNKFRVIAFVVASIVSTASFASAQSVTPGSVGAARASRVAQGRKGHAGLLHGVQLSTTEKAKLKEIRAGNRAQRERQKSDLRAALSPEHQKQFDANVQQASQHRGARAKKGRGRRPNA